MVDNRVQEVWKMCKPFASGSLAGVFATTCTHPVDIVKVRMQLLAGTAESVGLFTVSSNILKNEGLAALYKGSAARLTRQIFYTGACFGFFDKFTAAFEQPGKPLSFAENAGCALVAGGLAAFIANPVEAALARMQDVKPAAEGAKSSSFASRMTLKLMKLMDAASHSSEARHRVMFMKGHSVDWPTANRAMALNFGMLAFNASAKDALAGAGVTGVPQVFCASCVAGFFASFFSCPFDVVKLQMQSQKPDPVTSELPFKSSMDCAMKIMAEGGPLRFYAGFSAFYSRIAPRVMLTLIAQDAIMKGWSKLGV